MKILAASDLHGDFRAVRYLAKQAEKENVDVVLICGDITQFDINSEGMIGPFLEKNRRVMFVPGNHDSHSTADFIEKKYKITNLHGRYAIVGEVGFFGCGGANIPPNMLSEDEIMDYLSEAHEKIAGLEKKIMVTHVHPYRTRMEKHLKGSGSISVRKAIENFQPDMHLCGHMHESEGMEDTIGRTRIINVGVHGTVFEI